MYKKATNWKRTYISLIMGSCSIIPAGALAQTNPPTTPLDSSALSMPTIDAQGVDMTKGSFHLDIPLLNIGNGDSSLTWSFHARSSLISDNKAPTLSNNIASIDASGDPYLYVTTVSRRMMFTYSGTVGTDGGKIYNSKFNRFGVIEKYAIPTITKTFTNKSGTSSFQSNTKYIYTSQGGVQYTFYYFPSLPNGQLVDNIRFPSGNIEQYYYDYLNGNNAGDDIANSVISVENSYGMQIRNLNPHKTDETSPVGTPVSVSSAALNKAYTYCDPQAYTCSLPSNWARVSIVDTYTINNSPTSSNDQSLEKIEINDATSRKYTLNYSGSGSLEKLIRISSPNSLGGNSRNINYNLNTKGLFSTISSVTHIDPDSGGTLSYKYNYDSSSPSVITVKSTDPMGNNRSIGTDPSSGLPLSMLNEVSSAMAYTYDAYGNITKFSRPDGSWIDYTYDARGNVTEITTNPAPGTGLSAVHSFMGYDQQCVNYVKCNKPNWTKDEFGNETDFTYTVDGLLESVTSPAPKTGEIRPQIRYYYTRLQAYYLNSAGVVAPSGQPIELLSSTSQCLTQAGTAIVGPPGQGPFAMSGTASCVGSADEQVVSVDYGPQQNGVPNNLWPKKITIESGDGTIASSTSYVYDKFGNVTTIYGPTSNGSIGTIYTYNSARQLTGIIDPAPDGSGEHKNRALRLIYDTNGQISQRILGTISGQTDVNWATFSVVRQLNSIFDSLDRKIKDSVVSGGISSEIVQYSYDTMDRLSCSAVRMNTLSWGSLPSSACDLTSTASFGPDRINHRNYDAAGQLLKMTSAYGVTTANGFPTTLQRDDVTYTYNSSGSILTSTDANNNRTTYGYDGFGRLLTTTYPTPGSGDYEQLTYETSRNVVDRRLRDGSSVSYEYDALNRLMTKTPPNGEPSVSYVYNNLGQPTKISGSSNLMFSWDALGRKTSDSQAFGSLSYKYDANGRKKQITWQDGVYLTYDYDNLGNMVDIKEGDNSVLATFFYDDLGQRKSRVLANGGSTAYGFDGMSRLTSLTLAGSSGSNTTTISNYDPAGNIGSLTNSNDAFSWSQGYNLRRDYTPNYLNQYKLIAGAPQEYDTRGNLVDSGGITYAYTSENLLKSISTGQTLSYDPIGRMHEYDSSTSTRFVYDGGMISEEVSVNGAILRRYAFGPNGDEPIVWYEGTNTSDRRYMDQDERGSVSRITDTSGNLIAINSYDEHGIPGLFNQSRFGYTGQVWLGDIGLSYYKARFYSPTLGRFMQTDPAGYSDGENWYDYVHNNPINYVDPTGMGAICDTWDSGNNCTAEHDDGCGSVYCDITVDAPLDSIDSWGYETIHASPFPAPNSVNGYGRFDRFTPEGGPSFWNPIQSAFRKVACSVGNIDFGGGADIYAVLGGSVGGSFKLDLTTGQFGADGYLAVGVGLAAEAGPTVTFSSSGNSIVSANVITQVGGGYGVGLTGTRTLLGTNPGQNSVTVGKVGAAVGFANGGAGIGLHTPKLYDLGC